MAQLPERVTRLEVQVEVDRETLRQLTHQIAHVASSIEIVATRAAEKAIALAWEARREEREIVATRAAEKAIALAWEERQEDLRAAWTFRLKWLSFGATA